MGSKWFISYLWMTSSCTQKFENKVVDLHPILWLLKMINEYPNEGYRLIYWEEMKFLLDEDDISRF